MSEKTVSVKVITPEKVFFDGEVKQLIVRTKGEVGDFAILPDHMPLTSAIGLGKLELELLDGEKKVSTLFEGYTVVNNNKVIIICSAAEWPDEIDRQRAENAKKRAEQRLKEENWDYKRAEAALYRAVTRLQITK